MRRDAFFTFRKRKREAVLRKMAAMRAAKERKRLARGPVEANPKFIRSTGLSFAVRDDICGVVVWHPLKSLRDTIKRIALVLREYKPGLQ